GLGDRLEDHQEAHQELVVGHPDGKLVREPVGASHLTTTWWLVDRNSESGASFTSSLPKPRRSWLRRSYSKNSTSSTRSTPSTASSSWNTAAELRSASNGQPCPSVPPVNGLR